jgi:hypothetical protein
MIYTDGIHLIADTLDELHDFALKKLKFKSEWFQNYRKYPHYDLTTKRAFHRAINAGAKFVSSREIVDMCLKIRGRKC